MGFFELICVIMAVILVPLFVIAAIIDILRWLFNCLK